MRKSIFIYSITLFIFLLNVNQLQAQDAYVSSPRRALTAPELLDALDEWIERSLGWVNNIINSYRPDIIEHPVRRAALLRLDDIMHIKSAPEKALVQSFYHQRMEKAIEEIEQTRVEVGMRIWKLYNHGFFIRTKSVSFCFDIMRGTRSEGFPVSVGLMERLAEQADALFISHLHSDHADESVAILFTKRQKPVIAVEGLWAEPAEYITKKPGGAERIKVQAEVAKSLIYPVRDENTIHEIPVQDGKNILKVVAYPGHQGKLDNNVHLVTTPEGFTVIQTGDQYSHESGEGSDYDWSARIGAFHDVDVLLPNCWLSDIQRFIRGVDPKLVITGHENEMGHTVPHREDYTQTYNHLFGVNYPFIVMTWGESFHYNK